MAISRYGGERRVVLALGISVPGVLLSSCSEPAGRIEAPPLSEISEIEPSREAEPAARAGDPSGAPAGVLVCAQKSALTPPGVDGAGSESVVTTEHYFIEPMLRALREEPALREAFGSAEVMDCDEARALVQLKNELTRRGELAQDTQVEGLGSDQPLPWQSQTIEASAAIETIAPDPAEDPVIREATAPGPVKKMRTTMPLTSDRSLFYLNESDHTSDPYCTAFAISHRKVNGVWWTDLVTSARCITGFNTRPGYFDDVARRAVYYPTQVYMWTNMDGDGSYHYHGILSAYYGRHRDYMGWGDLRNDIGFVTIAHVDWPWRNNIYDDSDYVPTGDVRHLPPMRAYGGGLNQSASSAGFRQGSGTFSVSMGTSRETYGWFLDDVDGDVRPCKYDWGGPVKASTNSAVVAFYAGFLQERNLVEPTGGCALTSDEKWFSMLRPRIPWLNGLGVPPCRDRGDHFKCEWEDPK